MLAEDFPEVCFPIAMLDGKPQRCASQTCDGNRTFITWRADEIVLPTIPNSAASGAVVKVKPFAKARGVGHKRSDGEKVRPDLIIADDVQDDESAASPLQVNKNLNILKKNLLHTTGHRRASSIIVNGTVIAKDDLVEKLLADSAWQGARIPFVKSWSKAHKTFWLGDYATCRRAFDKSINGDRERASREATALYMSRRGEADEGCEVSWEERYTRPHEVSAIQHAYNVLIDDGMEVFATEYQNQPLDAETKFKLTPEWIASKTNGLARGVVPQSAEFVTGHIDVHLRVLYYIVCAWSKSFDGSVIDYGTYPRQPVGYFSETNSPVSMADTHPGMGEDAFILASLTSLTNELLDASYRREDGAGMNIGRLLVDARWGEKNKLVKQFCRRHPHAGTRLLAAQGLGIGPAQKPFDEYKAEPGTLTGLAWRIGKPVGNERWVTVDANWWKSCVAARLAMPLGTPGGLDLFGIDPREHALFADHCVAEVPVETSAKERTRDVWEWKPGRPDNHYWDNLYNAAVAASMLGATIVEFQTIKRRRRKSAQELADLARAAK
ncbi:hypothetical protein LCGC14_2192000 [marine sediment metagenome]|uniref:Terminase large subunit GpA endonuclease domain-containing protein n=1 Tax=marine sediment metagenome TaxID=412755 RepID=A0A0F9DJC4_9ZZZZ